jgi:hypothetical protein
MRTIFYCGIGVLLVCACVQAQYPTGRIVGTVTDTSGAPIPGVKIVVTNSNTGFNRETVTDAEGNFQVPQLPIGTYRASAEHSGFQKVVTGTQLLLINESVRFDIRLNVADETQSVQVEAEPIHQDTLTEAGNPTPSIKKAHAVYVAPGATFLLLWSEQTRTFSNLSTDALLEQFHRLRNDYRPKERKAKATLINLRETVAELARRHKFGLDQATDYSEFLFKYSLFGREPYEPMVAGVPPSPEILNREKDFRSALKSRASSSSPVISGSGVPLGLLEAIPAEEKQQLASGESMTVIRKFRPIHGVIGDKNITYEIALSADWDNLPWEFEKVDYPPSVQTVAANGQLLTVVWKFGVKAGHRSFREFRLPPINGKLKEYYAGKSEQPQTIDVPVPVVSIVPVPTFWEREGEKFSFWSAIFGAISGICTSLLAMNISNRYKRRRRRLANKDSTTEKEGDSEVQIQQPLDTTEQVTPIVQKNRDQRANRPRDS